MRVPSRHAPLALHTARPDWMTAGAIRLGILCVFIVLIEMLRPRLSPHSAWLVVIVGAAIMIAGAAVFVGATRRLAERLPKLRRVGPIRRRNATAIRGPIHIPVAAS